METIYLIRHSKTLKVNNDLDTNDLQLQNEKYSLSLEGEQIAQERLNNKIFKDIDILYSFNYVRAIQTAKYLANENNLEINIVSDLGERIFGISSWGELPKNFEERQFLDENINRNIAIVSHGTAIMFLL